MMAVVYLFAAIGFLGTVGFAWLAWKSYQGSKDITYLSW